MPTVLIATPDRPLSQILETALVADGHELLSVRDGAAALRSVSDETVDLLIMDIGLPRFDGFEVLEKLRASDGASANAPVVLMCSGAPSDSTRQRAHELGAAAILAKPVRLDVLLQTARDQLKASPESEPVAVAAGSREVRPATSPEALSGTLAQLSFPQMLHHLHGLRATGALLLGTGKKKKAIQVRDGYAVAVKSNLIGECLGNYLVRMGRLTNSQLSESIKRLKRGEGMQGQVLVAMELLNEEELASVLHEQALDKLYEIFEWKNGRFKFQIGARLQKANMLAVEESPANLILTGVRERSSIEEVDAFLNEHADRPIGRAESPFYRYQEVELNPDDERLLARVDGTHRARDLAAGDPVLRRCLYGLLVTGLLDVADGVGQLDGASAILSQSTSPTAGDPELDRSLRRDLAAMAKDLKGKNYFQMLGLDDDVDGEAVALAYEELATRTHPDRFHKSSSAVRQMADEVHSLISKAHDALIDVKSRREYLLELRRGERKAQEKEEDRIALEAETHFQRGESLLRQRDYEGALAAFGKALERFPEEGEYHAHYGWCLHLSHPDNPIMIEESIEHVRRGVKLARDREKPYLYLGRLYKAVGRSPAAEKMFTRALQIRPECVEAMRELRLINLRREKSRGLIGRLMRKVKS